MNTKTLTFVSTKFLQLIEYTNPHGSEKELLPYLPPLAEDEHGNFFCVIGEETPVTMFTAHLDTACREHRKINHEIFSKDGEIFVKTDGKTLLGADDKAGIALLCYMIEKQIPGLYYFFIGEEVGCIGSKRLQENFLQSPLLDGIRQCISFDRKGKTSIITEMGGEVCCSDEYATAVQGEFAKTGLFMEPDPTGVWTDSGCFIGLIPNCTNISIGYESAHSGYETQNLTFLDALAESCILVDWNQLASVEGY
jgi:hypothetical protein